MGAGYPWEVEHALDGFQPRAQVRLGDQIAVVLVGSLQLAEGGAHLGLDQLPLLGETGLGNGGLGNRRLR